MAEFVCNHEQSHYEIEPFFLGFPLILLLLFSVRIKLRRYLYYPWFSEALIGYNMVHKEIFKKLLSYTGNSLVIVSVFYLSIGAAYLIASEIKKEK